METLVGDADAPLAALRSHLALPSPRPPAAVSPARLRANRGLLERRRPSLTARSKKPGSVGPSPSSPTGRRGCVPRAAAPSIPDDRGPVDDSRSARRGAE